MLRVPGDGSLPWFLWNLFRAPNAAGSYRGQPLRDSGVMGTGYASRAGGTLKVTDR